MAHQARANDLTPRRVHQIVQAGPRGARGLQVHLYRWPIVLKQSTAFAGDDRNLDETKLIEGTRHQQRLDETDAVNANRLAGLRLQISDGAGHVVADQR